MWSGGIQNADGPQCTQLSSPDQAIVTRGKNAEAQNHHAGAFVCRGKGSGSGAGANVKLVVTRRWEIFLLIGADGNRQYKL